MGIFLSPPTQSPFEREKAERFEFASALSSLIPSPAPFLDPY
jgi:hypothetical protein